jgi:two-component system, chemotaxis family, chemotaxis protein CheY
MHALVIDDSRAMRTILGGLLRELGFAVSEAAHGRDGLARLRAGGAVDLVLVDWNMPEMDGLELVRAVRADRALGATRIVVVSTETELAQIERARQAGADEYVMKPFTRDALRAKLGLLGMA